MKFFMQVFFRNIDNFRGCVILEKTEKEAMLMTELSREIFENYQVRKTKKQKDTFIRWMQSHIPGLQVQEGGFPKCRNLVLGDPETAKVILSAHYDTCARLPFPNFITPKKPLLSIAYSILIVLPPIALVVLVNILAGFFIHNPIVTYWLSLCVYFLFILLLLAGPANQHTANDNTSGVITLLELYHQLPKEQAEKVCFVFFDNEEQGLLGSGYFRRKYKKTVQDKLLINFDCVSDGDHFLLGITKKANRKYHVPLARSFTSTEDKKVMLENLKKVYYPSDQAGFPVAIAVAALKHKKGIGYYMDRIHTKRDTNFDESNITYLTQRTIQFIETL